MLGMVLKKNLRGLIDYIEGYNLLSLCVIPLACKCILDFEYTHSLPTPAPSLLYPHQHQSNKPTSIRNPIRQTMT